MPPRRCRSRSSLHPELKVEEQPVAIRIGCHFGPVVLENRDVFGAAVHTANRMTSQAKAGQIITTATMVEQLSREWRASVRQIDVATLKGRRSEVALFEVLWQTEDVTSMVPAIAVTSRERANKAHAPATAVSGPGGAGRRGPRRTSPWAAPRTTTWSSRAI